MSPRGKKPTRETDALCIILFAPAIAVKHAFDEYNRTSVFVDGVRVIPNQLVTLVNLLWNLI